MWGTRLIRCTRCLFGAGLLLSLGACATHHAAPPTAASPSPRPEGRDATGAYRFNMTQDGRRMSADEFDAWMKARGIRVARGAPDAAPAARATAQAGPKPAKGGAKPKTLAQAGKTKPKAKPAVKEVSATKAVAKQGTGEG